MEPRRKSRKVSQLPWKKKTRSRRRKRDSSYKCPPDDPFLGVVENNDMETAQYMMETRKKSLARKLSCARDAFAQAIHDNHLGMISYL